VAKNGKQLKPALYDIPPEIDDEIVLLKTEAMGVCIDAHTEEQLAYIRSM
jgi:S-adenosylhomocysteine hydrolase